MFSHAKRHGIDPIRNAEGGQAHYTAPIHNLNTTTGTTSTSISRHELSLKIPSHNQHPHHRNPHILPSLTKHHDELQLPSYQCNILYSGSMFFWKDELYTEIDIIEHMGKGYIQICGYDSDLKQEATPVYIQRPPDITRLDETTTSTSNIFGVGLTISNVKLAPINDLHPIVNFILPKVQMSYETSDNKTISITFPSDVNYVTIAPEGIVPHKIHRKNVPTRADFDDNIQALRVELLKVSIESAVVKEIRDRHLAGIIVKQIKEHARRTAQISKNKIDPGVRWNRVLNVVGKRERVNTARTKLGLHRLQNLQEGYVMGMHDTQSRSLVAEQANIEFMHQERVKYFRNHKDDIDGVTINTHTGF